MLVLHGWIWFRMVRSTTRPGRLRRRLTWLVVALGLLIAVAVPLGSQLPLAAAAPLEWAAFSWLGIAFYLFLALLVLEPVRLVARLAGRRRAARRRPLRERTGGSRPGSGACPGRRASRLFLARGIAVTAGVVALGTAGTGAVLANITPAVRRVPITLPRLDPALDGLRIVTFSDAHLSATWRRARLERRGRAGQRAAAGRRRDRRRPGRRAGRGAARDVAPLADLVSAQGVFFVTGNHEYFTDTEGWMRHLPDARASTCCATSGWPIGRGGATFDLAGIDDRTAAGSGVPGHGADLDAALDGRDDAVPVVLLAHQPFMVEQARAAGVDLQLSGHTHGGQLWPFDYAIRLDQPAVEGLSRIGEHPAVRHRRAPATGARRCGSAPDPRSS